MAKTNSAPAAAAEGMTGDLEKFEVPVTAFPAGVAGLAILAAVRLQHRFVDEGDNEAERQADGSVRLSIKQREGGHIRVFVRVPETISLEVVDAPYLPE